MNRRLFIGSGAAATLAGCSSGGVNVLNPPISGANFRFGALLNAAEFAAAPAALPPEAVTTIQAVLPPASVTLTNLPPVVAQGAVGKGQSLGSPGSCEAQSWAYALGSYTAARNRDGTMRWNAADLNNQVSAAWMYSWALSSPATGQGACPSGSYSLPYPQQLIATGAPSVQQFAYYADCGVLGKYYSSNPNPPNQSRLQIGSYAIINWSNLTQAKFTDLLKRHLAAGNAIAFSGLVCEGYMDPSSPNSKNGYLDSRGVWQCNTAGGIPNSGHGQVIVGYDDTLQAFLVQNSFGTQWPFTQTPATPGRLYWSYDAMWNTQSYFGIAFPANNSGTLTGTILPGSSSSAPQLGVKLHSYDDADGNSRLVFLLDAASPIQLLNTTVVTPAGQTYTKQYNAPIRTGYTHVSRLNASFVPGNYTVTLSANLPFTTGFGFTYTGTVTLS